MTLETLRPFDPASHCTCIGKTWVIMFNLNFMSLKPFPFSAFKVQFIMWFEVAIERYMGQ